MRTKPKTPLPRETQTELQQLGEQVMDIVVQAAGRRLAQTLEYVHDDMIAPLRALLREAKEHVRHVPRCDGLDMGDARCDCGAVEYLSRVEAAVSKRGHTA